MPEGLDVLQLVQAGKRRYAAALRPVELAFGLTRNEIDVLLFLVNNPQYDTARDVVELRSLSKSHVCKSVDSLTRRGFLSGTQDRRDRRVVHLRVLPPACAAVEEAQRAQQAFFRSLYRGVPLQDRQAFSRVLALLYTNMKEAEHP